METDLTTAVPNMALRGIDRAIQAHGAAGISEDVGLAAAWAMARAFASPAVQVRYIERLLPSLN